jgi:hypothetical protein
MSVKGKNLRTEATGAFFGLLVAHCVNEKSQALSPLTFDRYGRFQTGIIKS